MREKVAKRYKLPLMSQPEDGMNSVATMDSKGALCLGGKVAKRADLRSFHAKKKSFFSYVQ